MPDTSPNVSSSSSYLPYGYVGGSGQTVTGNEDTGYHSPTSSSVASALAAGKPGKESVRVTDQQQDQDSKLELMS